MCKNATLFSGTSCSNHEAMSIPFVLGVPFFLYPAANSVLDVFQRRFPAAAQPAFESLGGGRPCWLGSAKSPLRTPGFSGVVCLAHLNVASFSCLGGAGSMLPPIHVSVLPGPQTQHWLLLLPPSNVRRRRGPVAMQCHVQSKSKANCVRAYASTRRIPSPSFVFGDMSRTGSQIEDGTTHQTGTEHAIACHHIRQSCSVSSGYPIPYPASTT